MKAADLFMVQYCAEHGGFRVLPLRTCVDLASQSMGAEAPPLHWLVVGYASEEDAAYTKMNRLKKELTEKEVPE